jgi:hypothetical protein
MAVFALWSAPRARSTAFFRSMLERGDLLALHEPLEGLTEALTWAPGERSEWQRSARWHADVSASSGFEQRERTHAHTVGSSEALARFADHHRPFYEQLHALRLDVAA